MNNLDDTPAPVQPADAHRAWGSPARLGWSRMGRLTSKRAFATRGLKAAAVAGGVAVASVGLAACNGSPFAATVNGQVISVAAINHQLAQWSSNAVYVSDVDKANSTAQGGTGVGVYGSGGPGTYSSAFVANIVSYNISFDALAQHLAATHKLPGPDLVIAARAVNESQATYWSQFPAALRTFLVDDLAYEAALVPSSATAASLKSTYTSVKPYLYSQLCLSQVSATTLAAAKKLTSGGFVGAKSCYDQAGVEAQSPAWQAAVLKLSHTGAVSAPIKTSYGYAVVKLASKSTLARNAAVDSVLSLVNAQSEPPQISAVINAAKVKVNPAYGTWASGQVTPPATAKG